MSLLRPMKKSITISAKPTRGTFHHPQRDRLPAQFLDQAPEDVAAVERQDRQQVDQAQREADEASRSRSTG